MAFAKKGYHILLEKPMAVSLTLKNIIFSLYIKQSTRITMLLTVIVTFFLRIQYKNVNAMLHSSSNVPSTLNYLMYLHVNVY